MDFGYLPTEPSLDDTPNSGVAAGAGEVSDDADNADEGEMDLGFLDEVDFSDGESPTALCTNNGLHQKSLLPPFPGTAG